MPTFTARVALPATKKLPRFKKLDLEMCKEHFVKTAANISNDVKFAYEEFSISGNYSLNEVLDSAVRAAANTTQQYALFVSDLVEENV